MILKAGLDIVRSLRLSGTKKVVSLIMNELYVLNPAVHCFYNQCMSTEEKCVFQCQQFVSMSLFGMVLI